MEGYLGYFNRDAIIKRAEKIQEKAPELLKRDDWDAIRELITIDIKDWNGPAADMYRNMVESICKNKNDKSKRMTKMLPDLLMGHMGSAQKMVTQDSSTQKEKAAVFYDYDVIIERAKEIRKKAPELLERDDWDAIRELITIGNEYWFGPSADKYQRVVDSICKNHDAESKRTVEMLPDALEDFMSAAQKKYSHS